MMIHRKNKKKKNKIVDKLNYTFVNELKNISIQSSLEDNKNFIEDLFAESSDFVIREFQIEDSVRAIAVFVDGLVDTQLVNETLKALMILEGGVEQVITLKETSLPVSQVQKTNTYDEFLLSVLSGDTGIVVDNNTTALMLGIRGANIRSISESETEASVRGSKEGFIENLRTNTSLIRRRLKTPHLKMKSITLGKHSNTNVVVTYMDGIVDPATLDEVTKRIQKIDLDAILESGYVEELIQDNAYTPFPQTQYTERPDVICAALLEGRIGILVEGTPFALIVPTTFVMLMQASEDYYERFPIGVSIRWLRYLFLFISLLTPALYVAAISFHQDIIPTSLLLSIAAAREAIPFPVVIEALLMEVIFEALREAGLRLPKAIGQTVSILGALVVGQAAVEAGIVSAPMVIVVSITGIASFTIPRFNAAIAIRMLRFPLIVAASLFGIYGIMLMMLLILGHMVSLRSFGVPYLAPLGPLSVSDLKDVLIRAPWQKMKQRPSFLHTGDQTRMGNQLDKELAQEGGQTGSMIEHDKDGGVK